MVTGGPVATPVAGRMVLIASPKCSRIDQPVRLAVEGLGAGSRVTLRVRTLDGALRGWESSATFHADESGAVDTAVHAPESGTYSGVDAEGLLWSMVPVDATRPVFFTRRTARPLHMTLSAWAEDEELGRTTFTRTFADPEVTATPVPDDSGLVGTLFRPSGTESVPGVLVLGGSDGGRYDNAAALLASHGYAALSLAYFGVEDTPAHLNHIELGSLGAALDWLVAQPGVDGGRLAVTGLSRGGELALQLGVSYPQIGAVVAGAPSSVRQAGLTSTFTDFTQPAWVSDGEPLPFVPGKYGPRQFLGFMATWVFRRPLRQRDMFRRLLHGDQEVVRKAAIEVERIAGRILLVSGAEDQLWPSGEYADLVVQRLREHDRETRVRHVSYPGAGHFVCFPYGLPSVPPFTRLSPVAGLTIDFGGTAAANAAAARRSWQEILDFLSEFRAGGFHQG